MMQKSLRKVFALSITIAIFALALVRLGILIKSGRTGRGVHYVLNPTYKGDIRGHEI